MVIHLSYSPYISAYNVTALCRLIVYELYALTCTVCFEGLTVCLDTCSCLWGLLDICYCNSTCQRDLWLCAIIKLQLSTVKNPITFLLILIMYWYISRVVFCVDACKKQAAATLMWSVVMTVENMQTPGMGVYVLLLEYEWKQRLIFLS